MLNIKSVEFEIDGFNINAWGYPNLDQDDIDELDYIILEGGEHLIDDDTHEIIMSTAKELLIEKFSYGELEF